MYLLLIILALGALWSNRSARAQSTETPPATPKVANDIQELEAESLSGDSDPLEYDLQSKTWVGRKGVIVRQGTTILVGNEVHVDQSTGIVVADGMVTLQKPSVYWTGEHLEYNFNTHEITSGSYRASVSGLFLAGETFSGNTTNKVAGATDATFTADDIAQPGYHIHAKKVRIVLGKEAVAEGATLYVGRVPLFYLPYYHRSLTSHQNYWVLTPGYRSTFGPYLLTEYHYNWTDSLETGLRLDYRAKRGPGVGPDINYDLGAAGTGHFEYYLAQDFDRKKDPALAGLSDQRQRLKFNHELDISTNFTAKASVNWQNDPKIVHDFYEGEYRTNSQPVTVFELNRSWSNFSLDAIAQPQVNQFFPTIERLPDIKLSALRQQLGVSPFFYEGESSFAYLRNRVGNETNFVIAGQGTNYAAIRADSYHQIVLPKTLFGFLTVTPRVGGRITHYGETDNAALPFRDEERFVFNTGMEASMKASRVFPTVRSRFFDVNELRHIIEPSVNYVYVPRPNVTPNRLPQFDSDLPSLRLRPVDFPDYNTIDSIDANHVMRLGLRNKLETKRDGEPDTLLNSYIVTDWRLDPRNGQTTFTDIYSDLDFKPRTWLVLNSETRYSLDRGEWNLAMHTATITPNDRWSIKLGHRYFRGDPAFVVPDTDNNIFFSSLFYRVNENWGARMSHHFEARDGTLEEQYYTVYRDFRSFTGALTLRVRDNRSGPLDYAVAFTISLKSRPTQGKRDRMEPSYLLGN